MADIIRLRGSPHDQTQSLLPWYVNGTLEPDEKALVEAHLGECAECRSELEFGRRLAPELAGLSMDADHGWAEMSNRLDVPQRPRQLAFLRRRVALGWAVAGQAAAAAAAALLIYAALPTQPANQTYEVLGSAPAREAGNMVVMFKPEASERDIRNVLLQHDARVVDGPNASGAYLVRVAETGRSEVLEKMRHMPQVILAEPVDAGPPQ